MQCTCRVCDRTYTYDDEVGYDRELCGPICDGREHGRRETGRDIERLQAELKTAYFCLGPDYDGEWDLGEKRRPLDSLVSEALAQKDNEIERLQADHDHRVARKAEDEEQMADLKDEIERLHARCDRLQNIVDNKLSIEAFSATEQGREIERLKALVDKLPKCWRLNEAGELVKDVPVVPGMRVFCADHQCWCEAYQTSGEVAWLITPDTRLSVGVNDYSRLYSTREAAARAAAERGNDVDA